MRAGSCQSTAPALSTQGASDLTSLALAWVTPQQQVLSLTGRDRLLIGRGDDADFCVADREASRHHAEIERDGPLWVVRDLGSRNGTFVDGERVQQAPLGPGSVLRLGESLAVAVLQLPDFIAERRLREVARGFFAGFGLQRILEGAKRVAQSDLPMLLEGETGSGKERVARWVHETSGRSGAFVAVNCAALPEALAEAELFGYRKGAFTGASQSSLGHFRAAQRGTLLLDEALDLPLALQAKLLRALEQQEVTPLGEVTPVPIDVRVVTACQAPLEEAVRAGRFRGDLFARLDGMHLRLPPLRERVEEVPLLFLRFLEERCAGRPPVVEARLLEALYLYPWPFNVRELELLARRLAVIGGHQPMLRRADLPARFVEGQTPPSPERAPTGDEFTRFVAYLRAHGGVVARAAEAAGISRMRAYRLMKERDFDVDSLRRSGQEEPS